jgi:hypothetical protein
MTERAFPQANLASERLPLRPFRSDDAVDVHAVWNDDAYLRFARLVVKNSSSLSKGTSWESRA